MTDQQRPFPKGDFRRLAAVLHAIDQLQPATLVRIAAATGLDKRTVTGLVAQADQAGVTIAKEGPVYTIADWGPVIRKSGLRKLLTGVLNPPTIGGKS